MRSCWDVPRLSEEAVKRGYGHLPEDTLKEWATLEADLSACYADKKIDGVSANPEGAANKRKMLRRLDNAIAERGSNIIKKMYRYTLRKMFEERLEDPGLLHNFEYFDVPSSDYMMMFYISTWTGKMADTMIYLHNYGWDLKGNFGPVPEDDVWAQMSNYEAMNISERIKAQSIVDWTYRHYADKAGKTPIYVTAFGGGNLPERFYCAGPREEFWLKDIADLPVEMRITVFDDGLVRDVNELFTKDDSGYVEYISDNLLNANSEQYDYMRTSQDLVWMHGVSMYLGPMVAKALANGFHLLVPGGEMKYDYLLMTESMRRVLATQGWPKGRGEMFIYNTPDEAIAQARKDVARANKYLFGDEYFDIEDIQTTIVEPWGPTCVRVALKKYCNFP